MASHNALDLGPGIAEVITLGSLGSPGIAGAGTDGREPDANVRAIL
jgi:hypothetical protein